MLKERRHQERGNPSYHTPQNIHIMLTLSASAMSTIEYRLKSIQHSVLSSDRFS